LIFQYRQFHTPILLVVLFDDGTCKQSGLSAVETCYLNVAEVREKKSLLKVLGIGG